jgi:tetratricopeptide (TPR) repeat protein
VNDLRRLSLFLILIWILFFGFAQNISKPEIDTLVSKAKSIYYASPDSAMILANEIISLSESINYSSGKFEGLRLVGNSHFLKGRLDSAAYYMLLLLDLAYEADDLGMQADVMIDIGQTYDKIGLHSLAYDYFWQAHNIRLKTGDAERLSVTFINLAYHYFLRDELDSAIFYYQKTEEILDTIALTYTKPFLYEELGGVYYKQGKIDLAKEYINRAIDLNITLNNYWNLSFNYIAMANIELASGNINGSEEYATKALEISEESNISIENDLIYKILSDVKREQGLYEEALEYLDKSYTYSDSLDRAINDQKILALDQYKREKENEITNLKLKNENLEKESSLRIQTIIIAGTLLILAITIVQLIFLFRQNRKLKLARKTIEDQNLDLQWFFLLISVFYSA